MPRAPLRAGSSAKAAGKNSEAQPVDSESDEEEVAATKPVAASAAVPPLKVKPSAGFLALNDKLLSAGRVSSVRLNLNAAAPAAAARTTGAASAAASPLAVADGGKVRRNAIEEAQEKSSIYDGKNSSVVTGGPQSDGGLRKKKTLGKGWFDMEPVVMDEALKRDVKMIQLRNYMDPKRFYKNPDKSKAVLHVGTVIEGSGEFKSSRMTKRERQSSILGEILADKQIKQYTKRKYAEIQDSKPQQRRKGGGKRGSPHKKQKRVHKLF